MWLGDSLGPVEPDGWTDPVALETPVTVMLPFGTSPGTPETTSGPERVGNTASA